MSELITRETGFEYPEDTWWSRYSASLASSGLSASARKVIAIDAETIVSEGLFGAGEPAGADWPVTRVRTGLVVGSVQSGKTASMLGVSAIALDRAVDVVVILSGTRTALWRQTAQRALKQLDRWSPDADRRRRLSRLVIPQPSDLMGRGSVSGLRDLYFAEPSRIRRNLEKRRAVLGIAMKNGDHLIQIGKRLKEGILAYLSSDTARALHMLVIDDEADDGSILDAVVESRMAPDSDQYKQIPRHIARLWAGPGDATETFHQDLYATYIAYTATPQSNVLQSSHNPLSPRDFVVSLRTPFDRGSIEPPRDITFLEPEGVGRYYSGGELFYVRSAEADVGLCVELEFPNPEEYESETAYAEAVDAHRLAVIANSLRAYFVAGAMRLLESGARFSDLLELEAAQRTEVDERSPAPHSMLLHPSARIADHWAYASAITAWARDPKLDSFAAGASACAEGLKPELDPAGLAKRLAREEDAWRHWFECFEVSRTRLTAAFPDYRRSGLEARWEEVKDILRKEIFPFARIRIINSHEGADDRPAFDPIRLGSGDRFAPAPDLCSIFVSGSVMSRGVTLEGLCTTLFSRDSASPTADTQMQMQRWFGYRGSHLHWCRVFCYSDQLGLFSEYHEYDEAFRSEIISRMNSGEVGDLSVLEGKEFRATGKVAGVSKLPLHPGPAPFVRLLGSHDDRVTNADVLAELLSAGDWEELTTSGTTRGLIRTSPLPMLEVADVLDALRYQSHRPNPVHPHYTRWASREQELDLRPAERPLFRPPPPGAGHKEGTTPGTCPYSIAAYLRFWHAALTQQVRGLFATDDHSKPWAMQNLAKYAADEPRFFVGIRYGDAGQTNLPSLTAWSIRAVTRQNDGRNLSATWGSRGEGGRSGSYLGDQYFDYHITGNTPPAQASDRTTWRPRGHDGLLLFHVVRAAPIDAVVPALAIPIGGPDQFSAIAPETPVA